MYKQYFKHFILSNSSMLHMAAHSHHAWPDCTLDAHTQYWHDSAQMMDDKWPHIFDVILPDVQNGIAQRLNLSDPTTVTFAPNTHDLLVRLFSCFEGKKVKILSTDSEFHSFSRQTKRWAEAGLAEVYLVPAHPFETFNQRFADAAKTFAPDFIYFSHVFFNSSAVVRDVAGLIKALPERAVIAVDGYHGFMALPTDLSPIQDRIFYLSGGYKYAMSGEGVCFMHCPKGWLPRPVDTGWYAGFGALQQPQDGSVAYGACGSRFMGATFDPSGLYRMRAVFGWLDGLGLSVEAIHDYVQGLQKHFLQRLADEGGLKITLDQLIPDINAAERGHFLTFETPKAAEFYDQLHQKGVITDYRATRLRFGFGIYHDKQDVDALFNHLLALSKAA